MDDLQYSKYRNWSYKSYGFKPCYKWMTFNTSAITAPVAASSSFKPCYKWMTFNTSARAIPKKSNGKF